MSFPNDDSQIVPESISVEDEVEHGRQVMETFVIQEHAIASTNNVLEAILEKFVNQRPPTLPTPEELTQLITTQVDAASERFMKEYDYRDENENPIRDVKGMLMPRVERNVTHTYQALVKLEKEIEHEKSKSKGLTSYFWNTSKSDMPTLKESLNAAMDKNDDDFTHLLKLHADYNERYDVFDGKDLEEKEKKSPSC